MHSIAGYCSYGSACTVLPRIALEPQTLPQPVSSLLQLNESRFVTGGNSGALQLWSVTKKKPLCKVSDAHGKGVTLALGFSTTQALTESLHSDPINVDMHTYALNQLSHFI